MNSKRQERFWNQVLSITSRGMLVPVVGEDMLVLPEPHAEPLYGVLAKLYASYLDMEVSQDSPPALSAVIRNHPEFSDNPHDIYQELGEEYEDLNPDIPAPLIHLARISHFNLFVSTTFDDLLERAINKVRFNDQSRTIVIPYSPKHIPTDRTISEALSSGRPVIFQLFGN